MTAETPWINLCGPCAAGHCTGPGYGGICEHACHAATPYCTGDRCTDCTPPTRDDPDDECCEATCGCCPRVDEHGNCWLSSGSDDDSKYCSQHGEGWLNDRSPEAELRYQILRNA